MRKIKCLISISIVLALLNSCGGADAEKFVGTWSGQQTMSVPDLEMNQTDQTITNISKSGNNEQQIILTSQQDNSIFKATVDGDNLTYEKQSKTQTLEGETVTIEIEGSGVLNGNVIDESGTVTFYVKGQTFTGTWTGTMTKQ